MIGVVWRFHSAAIGGFTRPRYVQRLRFALTDSPAPALSSSPDQEVKLSDALAGSVQGALYYHAFYLHGDRIQADIHLQIPCPALMLDVVCICWCSILTPAYGTFLVDSALLPPLRLARSAIPSECAGWPPPSAITFWSIL